MSEHIDLETALKLATYWTDKSYQDTPGGPTSEEQLVGKAILIMLPVVRAAVELQARGNALERIDDGPWGPAHDLVYARYIEARTKHDAQVKIMLDSLAPGQVLSDK